MKMKPLIKYYNLESRSWDQVSELEVDLHKHLGDQKKILPPNATNDVVKPILETLAQKVGLSLQGGSIGDVGVTFDPDDLNFEVLYSNYWRISPAWNIFRRRYGAEYVIKATPFVFRNIDHYLIEQGIGMKKAKKIDGATFNFTTKPLPILYNPAGNLFWDLGSSYSATRKFGIQKVELQVELTGDGQKYYGMVFGPIEPILSLRKSMSGFNVHFEREAITFS